MAIFPHTQILKLHAAVLSAQLASNRTALLGGIDPAFADSLPTCASASAQMLNDLHGLNAAERLGDGVVPFTIWLGNALALAGQRLEAEVFRSALAVAESAEASASHAGGQRSPPKVDEKVDEIADELSRLSRSVLLARGDDLTRCLYEVDALIARHPHHVEARLLRGRINRAVEEVKRRWGREVRESSLSFSRVGSPSLAGWSFEGFAYSASPAERYTRAAALAVQSHLRAPPIGFAGREREIGELVERIDAGGVAISGLEGVGKTALALALVELLAPRYPDPPIVVDLKGSSCNPFSAAGVIMEIVHLFLPAVPLPSHTAEITGMYHALLRGYRGIILLDDARDRAQVEPLLPPAGSAVIVTSRGRFALPGVHLMSLDGLDSHAAAALLKGITPRLDDHAASAIAELCGNLPFALRLAGAALAKRPDLSPAAYADRLRDAQGRHAVIDAAISVNLGLLDAFSQVLWCRLSLLEGDFTHCGFSVAREALGDLAEVGLIRCDPESGWYAFHESGRRLARSLMSDADRADAEPWAMSDADRADAEPWHIRLRAPPDRETRSEELWADALSAARRIGYRLAEAFYLSWLGSIRASSDDAYRAVELFEQALAIFRDLGDEQRERGVLLNMQELHDRFDAARERIKVLNQRAATERAEHKPGALALSTWRLAKCHQLLGDLDNAIRAMQSCVDIERTLGSHEAARHARELDELRASLKK